MRPEAALRERTPSGVAGPGSSRRTELARDCHALAVRVASLHRGRSWVSVDPEDVAQEVLALLVQREPAFWDQDVDRIRAWVLQATTYKLLELARDHGCSVGAGRTSPADPGTAQDRGDHLAAVESWESLLHVLLGLRRLCLDEWITVVSRKLSRAPWNVVTRVADRPTEKAARRVHERAMEHLHAFVGVHRRAHRPDVFEDPAPGPVPRLDHAWSAPAGPGGPGEGPRGIALALRCTDHVRRDALLFDPQRLLRCLVLEGIGGNESRRAHMETAVRGLLATDRARSTALGKPVPAEDYASLVFGLGIHPTWAPRASARFHALDFEVRRAFRETLLERGPGRPGDVAARRTRGALACLHGALQS